MMIRKGVIIIGASSLIGQKTAEIFAKNGYNIFATCYKNKIDNLKELEQKYNIKVIISKLDINRPTDIEKTFNEAFSKLPYIDSIICNAGINSSEKLLIDAKIEEIEKIINTNLTGTILCNREALKHFIQQKHGSIVNVSSIYGLYGGNCETVYAATKAGIIGLTKSLAQECGQFKIRVNAVAPGFIETKMTECFNDEEKKMIANSIPLQRLGTPEDVAKAIYFLSNDESSYITGEILEITGGASTFN